MCAWERAGTEQWAWKGGFSSQQVPGSHTCPCGWLCRWHCRAASALAFLLPRGKRSRVKGLEGKAGFFLLLGWIK